MNKELHKIKAGDYVEIKAIMEVAYVDENGNLVLHAAGKDTKTAELFQSNIKHVIDIVDKEKIRDLLEINGEQNGKI